GTGLFSLPREHGSSAQGGHFLAHRGRAACLLREWERRAEGAGAGAGTWEWAVGSGPMQHHFDSSCAEYPESEVVGHKALSLWSSITILL
ncbi:unnamed protein product, partial [Prorocentrum cordatum]